MAIDLTLYDHLIEATNTLNTVGGVPIQGDLNIDTAIPLDVSDANVLAKMQEVLNELKLKANLTETQPVSIASAPLPTGAATETTLTTVSNYLGSIKDEDFATETTLASILAKIISSPSTEGKQDNIITALGTLLTELQGKADLTETQPVSISSLPTPTGASTEAKQNDILTALGLLGTEAKLETIRVLLASLDAKDYATQTTLLALLSELDKKADLTETQPVSIVGTPVLASDAATETKQDVTISSLASILAQQQLTIVELQKKANLIDTQPVNIHQNELGYDAWGRSKSVTDKSLFSALFTKNIPVQLWKEDFNGTERVPTNAISLNGKLSITAGSTLNDVTILDTFRHLRYQPNRGHLYSTAGYIVNPTALMVRDFGVFTEESGTFFRIKTDGIYGVVATTYNSTYYEDERIIYTTAQLSTIGIDLSKGHTYDIQFEWRGVGNYKFFIDFKEVICFDYLNTRTELTMFNPSTPIAFRSTNLGDNDPMEFGCVDITSEGGEDPKGIYGSIAMDNISGQVKVSGYNAPVMAVRSKKLVNGLRNTRDTLSLLTSAYSDNKGFIRKWTTRDFTAINPGTQTWTDFGDGHLEYIIYDPDADTPMTFDTTKAQPPTFGCRVNTDDTYSTSYLFEGRTDIYQTPGDLLIFTMHKENGGDIIVGVTYEFSEEI